ncbi:MAG: DUF4177 domain-containing protein [Chitinophagaceae bacterium]|nr:MAG: DUF4177 domain-containing protein [Chitinophagaceae bacterium]
MKKKLLIAVLVLGITSCSSKWEYKIVTVKGSEKEASKFDAIKFEVSGESLNLFGKEGWELVDTFPTTETVHPNFGNSDYVTGMQPNVRTSEVNFVFKRKK